jgi:hypothetical protein
MGGGQDGAESGAGSGAGAGAGAAIAGAGFLAGDLRFGAAFFFVFLVDFFAAFSVFFLRAGAAFFFFAVFFFAFAFFAMIDLPILAAKTIGPPGETSIAPRLLDRAALSPPPRTGASPPTADAPGAPADMSPRWPNRSTRPYGRLEVPCPRRSARCSQDSLLRSRRVAISR